MNHAMSTTSPEFDEQMMRRAIRLAMNGRGRVEPNPMVGCVLVKEGRVIGEGFHAQYGGPHAEPTALVACTESPAGATAYVTLEPCCHMNKKTPPCVPALIRAKVARIVVGCFDPNPDVNGKGIQQLRDAGIDVAEPVLEPEAKQLIAPFIATTQLRRPYVTLKWAESADGRVAGPLGARRQISNDAATRQVHELRARCDAILIGVGTVLADDPKLTPRGGGEHMRHPVRAVLDTNLRTPPTAQLLSDDGFTVIYCGRGAFMRQPEFRQRLDHRKSVVGVTEDAGRVAIRAVLADLGESKVAHLLIEAGPTIAASFFASQLCDRLWIIRAPTAIAVDSAPAAVPVPSHFVQTGTLDLAGDKLAEYLNPASSAFFAAEPSADFVLAKAQADSITPAR